MQHGGQWTRVSGALPHSEFAVTSIFIEYLRATLTFRTATMHRRLFIDWIGVDSNRHTPIERYALQLNAFIRVSMDHLDIDYCNNESRDTTQITTWGQ